jgi:hypothetical protein
MAEDIDRLFARFDFTIEETERHFGKWDVADPVVWAILRVVQAQNDFAHAIYAVSDEGAPQRMLEAAITERREAIAALQEALAKEPRGFQ